MHRQREGSGGGGLVGEGGSGTRSALIRISFKVRQAAHDCYKVCYEQQHERAVRALREQRRESARRQKEGEKKSERGGGGGRGKSRFVYQARQ